MRRTNKIHANLVLALIFRLSKNLILSAIISWIFKNKKMRISVIKDFLILDMRLSINSHPVVGALIQT